MNLLIKVLIFTLPLVCSNLPEFFGFPDYFKIHGNYEFSKVLYFNIFSSIIIISYCIKILFQKQSIKIPSNIFIVIFLFLLINIVSTIFSIFPTESVLGGTSKGHSMLMWNNLIGLGIIFLQLSKKQISELISIFLYSILFVAIFGIWQYYSPSFDYGNLSNRAISTLGHPNYLAGLILISIPLLSTKKYIKKPLIRGLGFYITIGCLFLTKSWLAIVLFLLWSISRKIKFKNYSYLYPTLALLAGAIFGFIQFPEKLHSFISRFYIWETTLHIIGSDITRILTGFGSETLSINFDSLKSPELYLFENFGFTADRPHNIILNFFYHFGMIGLGIIISIYYFILKNTKNKVGISLGLIALFLLFNYASIALYLIIVLLLLSAAKKTGEYTKPGFSIAFYFIVAIVSMSSIYYSSKLYIAEKNIYTTDNYKHALELLPDYEIYQYKNDVFNKYIKSEDYYLEKLYSSDDYKYNCHQLISHIPSIENYFYCGKLLENIGEKKLSLEYYKVGINKLPDIWNHDSPYWKNSIIKKSISGNRFYSEKYGDIGRILQKLDITISQ